MELTSNSFTSLAGVASTTIPKQTQQVQARSDQVGFQLHQAASLNLNLKQAREELWACLFKSFEGFSGVRVQIDGKEYAAPSDPSQKRSRSSKLSSAKLRYLPSHGSVAKNAHGVINAWWDKSYSLPEVWMVRRLSVGRHTMSIELLPFNSSHFTNTGTQNNLVTDANDGNKGKFKILGFVSC